MIKHAYNLQSDDPLLLREFCGGSEEAFAALVARHGELVYHICLRQLRDANLAEDATQAVFLILAQKAPQLQTLPSLGGWLFQTARLAASNARRIESRQRRLRELPIAPAPDEPSDAADRLLLDEALATLPEADRATVLMRYYDQKTVREIAQSLRISEDAAEKRVQRSLERLKQHFFRRGMVCSSSAIALLLPRPPLAAAPAVTQSILDACTHAASSAAARTAGQAIARSCLKQLFWSPMKKISAVAVSVLLAFSAVAAYAHLGEKAQPTAADENEVHPAPRNDVTTLAPKDSRMEVFDAYLNVVRAQMQNSVAQNLTKRAKALLDLATAREEAGQVTKLDAMQAGMELDAQELAVKKSERALKDASERLQGFGIEPAANVLPSVTWIEKIKASKDACKFTVDAAEGRVTCKCGADSTILFQRRALAGDLSAAAIARQVELLKEDEAALLILGRMLDKSLKALDAAQTMNERGLMSTDELTRVSADATKALQSFIERKLQYAWTSAKLDQLLGKLPEKWDGAALLKMLY